MKTIKLKFTDSEWCEHKAEIDMYGCVKIDGVEIGSDDIQMIAHIAQTQRAKYFIERSEEDEQDDV